MKTSIGYPDAASTEQLLLDSGVRDRAARVRPILTPEQIGEMAALAAEVHVDAALVRYVRVLAETSACRPTCAWASRHAVVWRWCAWRRRGRLPTAGPRSCPEDIAVLAEPVLCHRLLLDPQAQFSGVGIGEVIERLLAACPPPIDRA